MKPIAALLQSLIISFAILAAGQWTWGAILTANLKLTPAIPWATPLTVAFLYAMWRVLSRRPHLLRARRVPIVPFLWTLAAGAAAAISLAGLWIVFFRLVPMTPNALADASKYPWWTMLAIALTGSLVSPITEEAAFRGYAQSILERAFSPNSTVVLSTILFTLAHITQGLFWPKLLVYFLFGLFMGTLTRINRSILPGIPAHSLADFIFFTMVWPNDASRALISASGPDPWFWIHVAQAAGFGVLAILALRRLAKSYNTLSGVATCAFSSQINSNSPAATA